MGDVMTPQISVIIPVYNGAVYIPELVEMLKNQTRQDFEVVFVNDGSKDNTKEVLDDLLQQHPFAMTVIHQENGGVSAARNKGLEAAKGNYICFIDADDQISRDYLQVLYEALETTGLQVAVGNITRNKQDLADTAAPSLIKYTSTEFLREFLYRGIRFSVCACMFNRACFADSFCFPVGFRYSEDVFLLWQLFAKEPCIVEVQRKLYYYYDNPNSAMNKGIDLKRMDAIQLMQKLETILAELAPEFSPEFNQYAVARHHWSILWQAAVMLKDYKAFREYAGHFEMKQQLKKLLHYPEKRISLSSRLYILCPRVYYSMLRLYVKIRK